MASWRLAVLGAQRPHVGVEVAARQHVGGDQLERAGAEEIASLPHQRQLVDDGLRGDQPAQAQPRGQRLGEGAEVDDQPVVVQLPQRLRRRTVEVELAVGIVLDHGQPVPRRQGQHLPARRPAAASARWGCGRSG